MLNLPPWIALVILAALLACGEQTPAPRGAEATVPASAGGRTATSAPAPEQTNTPQTVMTETPEPETPETPETRENPAATTPLPANSPTADQRATPEPPGVLAPLQALDSRAMFSELSDAEKECIGENPERQTRYIGCLEDETIDRIFLAGFVPGPRPISQESSDCVRAAFEVIDPRAVMTAGIEGNPGRAMAGSMAALSVTVACLNDQEWEETAPMLGMTPDERMGMQCLLAELGGPGPMAAAMTAAQEGDFTNLGRAGAECGMEMGPPPGQPPGTPPPAPTAIPEAPTPHPIPATTLVITVAAIPAGIPDYDRSDWRHWVDEDGDCQDARQEVLIAEGLVPVTYEDDRECRVETGQWWAPHLGHHLGNPSHIDVDHHVPLKNAHLSGGWRWDAAMKEEYANFLGEENHLIAISSRHNRSKGARGPEEWAPPDNALWCQYAVDWAVIKEKWELTMTPVESEIVMDMLGTCADPPKFEVETLDYSGAVTGELDPTAEPEGVVYESCEGAAAAGEQRVQGSQGGGEGFPKDMVPSARDGDGDGVVCEQ